MRGLMSGTVFASLFIVSAAALSQQIVANRDMEVHVGSSKFLGEVRIGKLYSGSTADPRQVLTDNTLTVKQGTSLLFSAYLLSGGTLTDVTRDSKFEVTPLGSDCITITAGSIVAAPQPACSERIDAAGAATGTFGISYVDDTNNVYGYDVFTVKVTK